MATYIFVVLWARCSITLKTFARDLVISISVKRSNKILFFSRRRNILYIETCNSEILVEPWMSLSFSQICIGQIFNNFLSNCNKSISYLPELCYWCQIYFLISIWIIYNLFRLENLKKMLPRCFWDWGYNCLVRYNYECLPLK